MPFACSQFHFSFPPSVLCQRKLHLPETLATDFSSVWVSARELKTGWSENSGNFTPQSLSTSVYLYCRLQQRLSFHCGHYPPKILYSMVWGLPVLPTSTTWHWLLGSSSNITFLLCPSSLLMMVISCVPNF